MVRIVVACMNQRHNSVYFSGDWRNSICMTGVEPYYCGIAFDSNSQHVPAVENQSILALWQVVRTDPDAYLGIPALHRDQLGFTIHTDVIPGMVSCRHIQCLTQQQAGLASFFQPYGRFNHAVRHGFSQVRAPDRLHWSTIHSEVWILPVGRVKGQRGVQVE